jgi:hypothetical protein
MLASSCSHALPASNDDDDLFAQQHIAIPFYNNSRPMPATTNKQPFVVYNAPASAPTSPATTRRGHHNPPVTPQRITRSAPRQQQYHFSPLTPATNTSTPYTPLSLRSLSSSGSTLTTPISAASRRLSLTQSPEVGIQAKNQRQKSLADIAHNWRNRANENGIKVTSSRESQYADDEGNCLPPPDIISWLLTPHRSGAPVSSFFTLPICLSQFTATDYTNSDVNSPALAQNDGMPIFSSEATF